jgi:hypothetical protein
VKEYKRVDIYTSIQLSKRLGKYRRLKYRRLEYRRLEYRRLEYRRLVIEGWNAGETRRLKANILRRLLDGR